VDNILINAGGIVRLAAGAVASGGITFAGSGGELVVGGLAGPAATLKGFALGDVVDLANLVFSAADKACFLSHNVLAVSEGGLTLDLQFDPTQSFAHDTVKLLKDAGGGTEVTILAVPVGGHVAPLRSDTGDHGAWLVPDHVV
jgi:hypothetical protein